MSSKILPPLDRYEDFAEVRAITVPTGTGQVLPPGARAIKRGDQIVGYIDVDGKRTDLGQRARRQEACDRIDDVGSIAFLAAHPEYHRTPFNAGMLDAWLREHGGLPFTRWNLEIAYRDLRENGLLEISARPEPGAPAKPQLPDVRGIAVIQPTAEEEQSLAKLADDPSLSDHQRKTRLTKLALLAGKQRREMSSIPGKPSREHPDGGDPPICI